MENVLIKIVNGVNNISIIFKYVVGCEELFYFII